MSDDVEYGTLEWALEYAEHYADDSESGDTIIAFTLLAGALRRQEMTS